MKTWMLALSLIAVLGMTSLADAKAKGKKGKGIKGTIATVTDGGFTMTPSKHGKKNAAAAATTGQPLTVKYSTTTLISINGVSNTKIDPTMVGKSVTVIGSSDGTTVTASQITVTDGKHKKKKNT